MSIAYTLGRILLPLIFVLSGIQKLLNVGATAKMIAGSKLPVPDELAAYLGGMPKYEAVAYFVGAIEVICGLMIIIGLKARWGAAVLILFTAATTFFFHNFWDMTGDISVQNQIHALKNLSIIGGLLLVFACGSHGNSLNGLRA